MPTFTTKSVCPCCVAGIEGGACVCVYSVVYTYDCSADSPAWYGTVSSTICSATYTPGWTTPDGTTPVYDAGTKKFTMPAQLFGGLLCTCGSDGSGCASITDEIAAHALTLSIPTCPSDLCNFVWTAVFLVGTGWVFGPNPGGWSCGQCEISEEWTCQPFGPEGYYIYIICVPTEHPCTDTEDPSYCYSHFDPPEAPELPAGGPCV